MENKCKTCGKGLKGHCAECESEASGQQGKCVDCGSEDRTMKCEGCSEIEEVCTCEPGEETDVDM